MHATPVQDQSGVIASFDYVSTATYHSYNTFICHKSKYTTGAAWEANSLGGEQAKPPATSKMEATEINLMTWQSPSYRQRRLIKLCTASVTLAIRLESGSALFEPTSAELGQNVLEVGIRTKFEVGLPGCLKRPDVR